MNDLKFNLKSRVENQEYLREIFYQNTATYAKGCIIDLTKVSAFSEKSLLKEVKKFLPVFLRERENTLTNHIIIKLSNSYPSLFKYALQNHFSFQKLEGEIAYLKYNLHRDSDLIPKRQASETQTIYNPKEQALAEIMIGDSSNDPRVPHASRLDDAILTQLTSQAEADNLRKYIQDLNPNLSEIEIFKNKLWDIEYYEKENYPIVLGTLTDLEIFSSLRNGIGMRFLDMPIHMPNLGWRIPSELTQFIEPIAKAVSFEKLVNPYFEQQCYVYITVDQGEVEPRKAQRRTGWHGDSYLKIDSRKQKVNLACDHVYVIADNCPTPFLPGPFSLKEIDPENIDEVNFQFAKVAEGKTPHFYPNYTLLRLDPYCVHNVGFNESNLTLTRTFVKISISQSKYCKLGNAQNPLFVYDWPRIPRHGVPYNNKALQQSAHRKDRDHFLEINPHVIEFTQNTVSVEWAKPVIHTAIRVKEVYASPAQEMELLSTFDENFLQTIFSAEKGDWKVTASHNHQYFLSGEKLLKFYTKDPLRDGIFQPKPIPRRVIELTKDVRFLASWGTMQYAQKGDMLMCADKNDIYAMPRRHFNEEFSIIS